MERSRGRLTALLALAASAAIAWVMPQEASQKEEAAVKRAPRRYSKLGYDLTPPTKEQLAELLKKLTPEQVDVTQRAATERPGCGVLLHEKRAGTFLCVVCGLPLFKSGAKFESGTGWPSFFAPFAPDHVAISEDDSHGMTRDEITCARDHAHLGHVFDDGPPPTGKRFCLNSASLRFVADGEALGPESKPVPSQVAYFAGGCFWGVEDAFEQMEGVIDAESGYMNGSLEQPSYKQVCSGRTGHAETVKVIFDPARTSFRKLLEYFFKVHDPTTMNRQGPDFGEQYRSAVFFVDDAQEKAAQEYVAELSKKPKYEKRPIVTAIEKAKTFWPAEEYHQDYHAKHGGSCRVPTSDD